jgi:hypothetical protein
MEDWDRQMFQISKLTTDDEKKHDWIKNNL